MVVENGRRALATIIGRLLTMTVTLTFGHGLAVTKITIKNNRIITRHRASKSLQSFGHPR
jgi:hypothetical protein